MRQSKTLSSQVSTSYYWDGNAKGGPAGKEAPIKS